MNKKALVSPAVKAHMDSYLKMWSIEWDEKKAEEKAAAEELAREIKLQRNYSKWLNRRVDKLTVRMNDGTNHCQPPQVWLVLGQRLAA
jgi:hypothetical protein